MTQQIINNGAAPGDGTGDTLYVAFEKVNENFTELYSSPPSGVTSVNGQSGVVVLDASSVGAEPADATILKDVDIGVSVQGFNADTVIDAAYVHTDNNYTSTEKNKLAGIEAGAEVNVNADWNAVSGDAQILNKPTLGTAAAANTTDFATAAQGALADSAAQPNTTVEFSAVTVAGDLTVNGSLTTVNTETLQVQDPIIYVASGATGITTLDQGIVGHTVTSGTYNHMGLVRDHTDAKWKLFKGVTTEPTTVINWSQAVPDTLYLGTVEAVDGVTIGGNSVATQNWVTSQSYLTTSSAASTYQPIGSYLTSSDIGTTVQAYDADLTSWAAITPSTKQDTLISATNIKTINGSSVLGSGDLTVSGSFTGGTLTSELTLAAGSSSTPPLSFQTGTITTSPTTGDMEYDGNVFYGTVGTGNRGVMPAEHFVVLQTTNTLTSQTAAQPLFDGGGTGLTNGALSLGTGTFFFECMFHLASMSTTSGSFGFAIGGTATKTQYWEATAKKSALATAATAQVTFNTAANTTLATASTTATGFATITGTIDITVAGTVIPQISLGVAAAAVVQAGSYFKIRRMGSNTVAYMGNWT